MTILLSVQNNDNYDSVFINKPYQALSLLTMHVDS